MKNQVLLLLVASVSFVLANHPNNSTGRPELNIDGIPQSSITQLQEMMRNTTTQEQRKAAITAWENTLPSDQQDIAKTFFAKWEQQHANRGQQ